LSSSQTYAAAFIRHAPSSQTRMSQTRIAAFAAKPIHFHSFASIIRASFRARAKAIRI